MILSEHVSMRSLILVGCASLLLTAGAARADLEAFDSDLGRFATWDSEAGDILQSWDGAAGESGGGMVIIGGVASPGFGVEHYAVLPNTFYMVTASIQLQAAAPASSRFGMHVKAGNWDASNLNSSPGTWFTPGAWRYGAVAGSDTEWSQTDTDWKTIGMSVVTGPSDAVLSVGFSIAAGPSVHIDDVHVTQPALGSRYSFDESPYIVFDATSNGYYYDGVQSPDVTLKGVLPGNPANIRMYVPTWMTMGVGGNNEMSIRETVLKYSGAAWRLDNTGAYFDDASPAIPLTTVADTVYTLNFWMVRDRSDPGNAWVSWDPYSTHVAWRLTDDPWPISIEGYSGGSIQANAFHLVCEGDDMAKRNYAPDIYAPELTPGNLRSVDCVDPEGNRYSTMAFQAADDTSWFEACIRGNRQGGMGTATWIMDDLRLYVHGEEDLLALLVSGVDQDTLEAYE